MNSLREIYWEVMQCPKGCQGQKNKCKIPKNPPRGFWFPDHDIKLFLVANNPSSPRKVAGTDEETLYKGEQKDVESHRQFARLCFENCFKESGTDFHRYIRVHPSDDLTDSFTRSTVSNLVTNSFLFLLIPQ